jgi:hypothetical protein
MHPRKFVYLFLALLVFTSAAMADPLFDQDGAAKLKGAVPQAQAGIAWRIQGGWQGDARIHLLQAGDLIRPGSLLLPSEMKGAHSITIFLPDGQRILYECFTEEDCSRGFRVPALTETPSAFATQMLRQISHALLQKQSAKPSSQALHASQPVTTVAKRDEVLVILDRDGNARVGGLLASLPNGAYTYNLLPLDHTQPSHFHVPLEKSSSTCLFPARSPGLYEISIWDKQNTPRIDLLLAAIEPAQTEAFSSFARARKLLEVWDAQYYGWPVHDLLRAYLESLMKASQRH